MTDAATTPVVAASSAPTKIDRVGEAAAHGPEQLADGVEEVLGHAGAFEDQAHEGEERDRQQHLVRHHLEDALRQRLEERPGQGDGVRRVGRELDREDEEQEAVRGEREGDRISEQEEHHQRREHDRREVLGDQLGHQAKLRDMPGRERPRVIQGS